MLKKALLILLCTILCVCPLLGCSEDDTYEIPLNNELLYGRNILSTMPNSSALLYAYDTIVSGVNKSLKEIDVSNGKHNLSKDELKIVVDVYRRDHVEHFWFGNSYKYTHNDETIINLIPQYTMSGYKLKEAKRKLEESVLKLLDGITSSMSEYERELLIHDSLAQNTVYAESKNSHNLYGAIVEGKAVCEGYAEAFQYLLNRAGISSFIVIGDSKNPSDDDGASQAHAWNLVRIDNEYYHVDPTWNDQTNHTYHSYFNVSDSVILQDHEITPTDYQLPSCNSNVANYFVKNDTYITDYTIDDIVTLFDENNKASLYISSDPNAFLSWYKNNITSIAEKLGIKGAFEYSSARLGNEIVLSITRK